MGGYYYLLFLTGAFFFLTVCFSPFCFAFLFCTLFLPTFLARFSQLFVRTKQKMPCTTARHLYQISWDRPLSYLKYSTPDSNISWSVSP